MNYYHIRIVVVFWVIRSFGKLKLQSLFIKN